MLSKPRSCKVTRTLIAILISLAVFFCVFTIWYHIPVSSDCSLTLSDSGGHTCDATFSLVLYRSFFSPTVIRGKIVLDGTEYTNWVKNDLSLREKFSAKMDGRMDPYLFANAANFGKSTDTLLRDLLVLNDIRFDRQYAPTQIEMTQTVSGILWHWETSDGAKT